MHVLVLEPQNEQEFEKCLEFQKYLSQFPQLQFQDPIRVWNEFSDAYDNYRVQQVMMPEATETPVTVVGEFHDGTDIVEGEMVFLAFRGSQYEPVIEVIADASLKWFPTSKRAIFRDYCDAVDFVTPMMTTEDGEDVYEGQEVFKVDNNHNVYETSFTLNRNNIYAGHGKYFRNLVNAHAYAEFNRKQFSLADLAEAGITRSMVDPLINHSVETLYEKVA